MSETERSGAASRAEGLRALRDLLRRIPADGADELGAGDVVSPARAALRAADRLDRDLLPRTAGGDEHLVVGIVGPNNAGKSALFNALAAGDGATPRILSPSRATGGATRRLVGALRPELRARLEAEPSLSRFPMRGVTPGPAGALEALEGAESAERGAAELLLVEVASLPAGLLLVDTPDFDSVLRTNRDVAAALLRVADVAVVVVTRHTYQNHDVVEFLARWLAHGRPWLLVYNEALDDATTTRHATKLAEDVGAPPVGVFRAAHDPAVARGEVALSPVELGSGRSLAAWLRDQGEARALKERALAAGLAQLRDDLVELVGLLREEAHRAAALQARVASSAAELGREAARETMPSGVFLDAFRRVLDRRPTLLQRRLRGGLQWTGARLESSARWLSSRLSGRPGRERVRPEDAAVAAERAALARRWTPFHEDVVRALRPARDGALGADPALHRALEVDLAAPGSEALGRALATAGADARELEAFGETCEALVEAELERGSSEWALQLGVDVLHLLPAVAAGAVILQTGGLGADVAVAGGGAVSSVLAERLSRLLGSAVAADARARWAERRGARLAELAAEATLPTALPLLERRASERRQLADQLDAWLRAGIARPGERTHGNEA